MKSKDNEIKKIKRIRIKAVCRRGNHITLPCNWLNTKQLVDGAGLCGADGLKCLIVREIKR